MQLSIVLSVGANRLKLLLVNIGTRLFGGNLEVEPAAERRSSLRGPSPFHSGSG
jgi:hypothetical protein